MASTASYRDLVAWQKAMRLVEACYGLAGRLPRDEQFALGSQMRRAAVSTVSNIAEGQRLSKAAFRSYLRIALGSAAELETQLELAARLGFLPRREVDVAIRQSEEVARLIRGLVAALKAG
jgi:four helix bundle protein